MATSRKKLPIGIQTFAKLRNENCYYADKSGIAVDLVERGQYYFLSRPRRFGKSLFIDTLKELFEGNQLLFEGLQAENRWDWSKKHPIIYISFSDGVLKTQEELRQRIGEILDDNKIRLGVACTHESYAGYLSQMIRESHKKYGERVVVLVDEYDKPILDNITNREVATEMREGLMFQAGYLTIESEMVLPGYKQYTLRFPNMEVKASMNRLLVQRLMGDARTFGINGSHLYMALLENDFEKLKKVFHQFFSSIPYNWYINNPMAQYKGYYASIFYSHFAGLGVDVMVEDATNHGRIDMTVLFNQRVYIFEFKVEELTPSGKALQQIKDRNYADKYKARNEPIYLIGVEFSKNNRNIIGFDVECNS